MKKEVLKIDVSITGIEQVEGCHHEAVMISFSGRAEGDFFTGTILPGAIDTQQQPKGMARSLSARYILSGKDGTGTDCRIFIENNGRVKADEPHLVTHPTIITDSENLSWLETAPLEGRVIPSQDGVRVYIYSLCPPP